MLFVNDSLQWKDPILLLTFLKKYAIIATLIKPQAFPPFFYGRTRKANLHQWWVLFVLKCGIINY